MTNDPPLSGFLVQRDGIQQWETAKVRGSMRQNLRRRIRLEVHVR